MPDSPNLLNNSLDPTDWSGTRQQGHAMLDDMFDYLEQIRQRPVWQPIPNDIRNRYREPLPENSTDISLVHQRFMTEILPYSVGNTHPGFMGWVHGGGSAVGMLAEMLAGGLNANLGGRDQIPIEVEKQIVKWTSDLFEFPDKASGLFVTGTSMANLLSVLIARTRQLGISVRQSGLTNTSEQLVAYTSKEAHGCIAQAMDLAGLGSANLRCIDTNEFHQIDIQHLKETIKADRKKGFTPFYLVGTAGTVNSGAIDNLSGLADVAREEKLWFHVDGAYGALAKLSPSLSPRLNGIEQADSIAFDFHKWLQVPYDAGFLLVRDSTLHQDTFASPAAYLQRETRGLAAGSPWPCDLGPDLSRGFKALKTWFTLQVYGTKKLASIIDNTCELARYLTHRIYAIPELELLAPVSLNIVCFRFLVSAKQCADLKMTKEDIDKLNADIVVDVQESGIAAPSTTWINGQQAIRVAIFNHRTVGDDIEKLLGVILCKGRARVALIKRHRLKSNELAIKPIV